MAHRPLFADRWSKKCKLTHCGIKEIASHGYNGGKSEGLHKSRREFCGAVTETVIILIVVIISQVHKYIKI